MCSEAESYGPPDALRDAENALRDFVDATMAATRGADWQVNPQLTSGKYTTWQRRLEQDRARSRAGMPEDRLLYYANLGELLDLVMEHWDAFAPCFGEKRRFLELTGLLRQYRNQVFHGRDLLAHERQLVLGISGLIRAAITQYRTKEAAEMADRFFPQLECLRDSLGNMVTQYTVERPSPYLQVGATVEFVAKAFDPLGEEIEYRFSVSGPGHGYLAEREWQTVSRWVWHVTEQHIGQMHVYCRIRSPRSYHLRAADDDSLELAYVVLPSSGTRGSRSNAHQEGDPT